MRAPVPNRKTGGLVFFSFWVLLAFLVPMAAVAGRRPAAAAAAAGPVAAEPVSARAHGARVHAAPPPRPPAL